MVARWRRCRYIRLPLVLSENKCRRYRFPQDPGRRARRDPAQRHPWSHRRMHSESSHRPTSTEDALVLHEDRFFDPDPTVRGIARALYDGTRGLPLICPHGHVDPALLATDAPFPEPTALLIIPDHYIFRMLYSRGVPMESMGVPTRDGSAVETDPRK